MFDLHATTTSLPPDTSALQETEIDSGSYVFRDESILGTRMQIQLVARNHSDALAAALNARSEIDRLNTILNHRNPDSELNRLNRSSDHLASPELFAVVEAAERWRFESGGAFSGRLGHLIDRWSTARERAPSREELGRLAHAADDAVVETDASTRSIRRPDAVQFALDALAKGWIVDRAYESVRSSPGISGALVDIGGDVRCGGRAPDSRGWCVGIPDATSRTDNAPLVATARLSDRAFATSGRGPRDRVIATERYSATLSPRDGWPIDNAMSASVAASSAADADAIATILLTLPKNEAIEWANQRGVPARIQTQEDVTWTAAATSGNEHVQFTPIASPRASVKSVAANSWPKDWSAYITFSAPPRQLVRDHNFRSPFMAMWITDVDNKPIRTLLLVGKDLEWQQDNYIWWGSNTAVAEKMVNTRSMSTAGAGIYKILWDGTDDTGEQMPGGTYVLHIETSRERGRHTHRSMELDFSKPKPFREELPSTEEAGGVLLEFYRP